MNEFAELINAIHGRLLNILGPMGWEVRPHLDMHYGHAVAVFRFDFRVRSVNRDIDGQVISSVTSLDSLDPSIWDRKRIETLPQQWAVDVIRRVIPYLDPPPQTPLSAEEQLRAAIPPFPARRVSLSLKV